MLEYVDKIKSLNADLIEEKAKYVRICEENQQLKDELADSKASFGKTSTDLEALMKERDQLIQKYHEEGQ